MKSYISRSGCFLVVLLTGLIITASGAIAQQGAHKQITLALMDLLKTNPEIESMLEASIGAAGKINPDPKTNPVQSLDDYFDYVDSAAELIPQNVLENPANLVRDQILQSICYFYFLVDQPLPELEDKGYFKNSLQYYPPFAAWTREFANAWGDFLDTEESWNQQTYQGFYNDPRFGLQEDWYEPESNWSTFNDFFSKYLRSRDVRPIASPDDPAVVVAPADSVPQGVWEIDSDSRIRVEGGLQVKLARFYSVSELLGDTSTYKDAFAGGILTHTFLNVNDYHRYHFAVGGTVLERTNIAENVALEVVWSQEQGKYVPIDSTGWQFTQTRGYVIVDTGNYGLVALIPMGMAQVSSVNFEGGVRPGITHEKGDMLGNFLFGGSDFVMLFQDKAGFELTAPKSQARDGDDDYEHLLMGEAYGRMTGEQ